MDELSPTAPVPTVPPVVEIGVPTELLRRRADIRRAERQIAAANARIGVAVADYYPKFSLTGDFGFDSSKFKGLFDWGESLSAREPQRKLERFSTSAAPPSAFACRRKSALKPISPIARRSCEPCRNARMPSSHIVTSKRVTMRLAAAVTSARDSVRISRDQYKQGLIDFLQVLDAQRQLLSSDDALAQSDMQIATNLVGLYKALGGGWEMVTPVRTAVEPLR